jgi:hypothetical protein
MFNYLFIIALNNKNKIMKKTLLILLVFMVSAFAVNAQTDY